MLKQAADVHKLRYSLAYLNQLKAERCSYINSYLLYH